MEAEELFLCLPCAERLRDFQAVESVKVGRHRRDKDVCEQCGRRRFGYLCEAIWREPGEKKQSRD